MFKKNILLKLDRFFKILFVLYLGIIFYLSAQSSVAQVGLFNFPYSDKVIHFVEYSLLALIGYFAFRKIRNYKLKLLIFGLIFAFSDEIHQLFVPNRVFDYYDLIMDILPFLIIQFIKYPLNVSEIKIKGKYKNKIYELLRSIIFDINIKKSGRSNFTIWIQDKYIYYFYKNKLFYKKRYKLDDPKQVKKEIYLDLKNFLEREISKWGIIYITRPIKKLHYIEGSYKKKKKKLKKKYLVSSEKANLMMDLYKIENRVVSNLNKSTKALYVNIPFCPSKCAYCSFTSYSLQTFSKYYKDYIKLLKKELYKKLANNDSNNIRIIYFGGGTPMTLENQDLIDIFNLIFKFVDKSNLIEFTFEGGRPELFSREKLNILENYGINRIAINPQSLNSKTLNKVEREHSIDDFYKAYHKTIKYNFQIINSDLILGLPGENYKHHIKTVNKLLKLERINNITVHILSPKKGSKLYQSGYNFNKSVLKSHKKIDRLLKNNNFRPYYLYKQRHILDNLENIGYEKNGELSYYNIIMISETHEIIGAGAGASSKLLKEGNMITERNPKGLVNYIKTMEKKIGNEIQI